MVGEQRHPGAAAQSESPKQTSRQAPIFESHQPLLQSLVFVQVAPVTPVPAAMAKQFTPTSFVDVCDVTDTSAQTYPAPHCALLRQGARQLDAQNVHEGSHSALRQSLAELHVAPCPFVALERWQVNVSW